MQKIGDFLGMMTGLVALELVLRNELVVEQLLWAQSDSVVTVLEVSELPWRVVRRRRRWRHFRRRLYLLRRAARAIVRRDRRTAAIAVGLALTRRWP